jgi:hypothetical protein
MKKIFIVLFGLATAVPVFAAQTVACSGTAGNGTVIGGVATNFVRNDILPKCSANTLVDWDQSAIGFAVAAASIRGKNIFTGNTGGGAVTSVGTCSASPCAAGMLTAPLATALAAAT